MQTQCRENTKGVENKNWVMRDIANTLICIPPLAEQKRIQASLANVINLFDKKERLNSFLRTDALFYQSTILSTKVLCSVAVLRK